MNRISRFVVASCAGIVLACTTSPALAARPSDTGSKGATVEHVETDTRDYRSTTQYFSNENYTSNSRSQETSGEYSSDYKTQYTERRNVSKLTSQNTAPNEFGETCITNSQSVFANGDQRVSNVRTIC